MMVLRTKRLLFTGLLWFLGVVHILNAQSTKLLYDNYIYEPNIRTVQFYKGSNELSYPIYSIARPDVPLTLEFDELSDNISDFYATVLHCDADWNPSTYLPIEYFQGFTVNNQIVNSFPSANTLTHFHHYRYSFPGPEERFLISGNYLLKIYRDNDPDQVVITRRFIVVEPNIKIETDMGISPQQAQRFKLQSVNFNIFLSGGIDLNNPFADPRVMILQNFRWDNAKQNLKPVYQYPDRLEYRFDANNDFNGGNEYRFFDVRTVFQSGGRTRQIARTDSGFFLRLEIDRPRANKNYVTEPDFNGSFFTGVRERPGSEVDADYIHVRYSLKMDAPIDKKEVYIFGQLSDWRLDPRFKMEFVDGVGYMRDVLLKQGIYNYLYVTSDRKRATINEQEIEGSFFETENYYTILVYYKNPNERSHRIVGIQHVNYYDR
jgi:hypothetical protein